MESFESLKQGKNQSSFCFSIWSQRNSLFQSCQIRKDPHFSNFLLGKGNWLNCRKVVCLVTFLSWERKVNFNSSYREFLETVCTRNRESSVHITNNDLHLLNYYCWYYYYYYYCYYHNYIISPHERKISRTAFVMLPLFIYLSTYYLFTKTGKWGTLELILFVCI